MTLVLAMLYLILIYDTGTCHAILETWYMTPVLDMLFLTPDTCITWHMHDFYIITRHLVLLYLLYSCTPVSPTLILMLIAQSFWRPASMPGVGMTRMYPTIVLTSGGSWMELSATRSKVPHHTRGGGHLLNLWGPPLESVGLLSLSCLYRLVLGW